MAPGYGALLSGLCEHLRGEGLVGALLVFGSTARGEADCYSDLDLILVAREGEAERVAEGLVELLEQLAVVVMARWNMPKSLLSVVLSDWRRVDLTVLDAESVRGRQAGPALCVYDDLGIGEIAVRVHVRSADRLLDQIERFLRSLGLLVRDVRRGDLRLFASPWSFSSTSLSA